METSKSKHFCEICCTSFSRKIFLTKHYKTQKHKNRLNGNIELFTCSCGKKYNYKNSLILHKKTCTVEEEKNAKGIALKTVEKRLGNVEVMLQEERVKDKKLEEKDKYIKQLEKQVKRLEEALQNALRSPSPPAPPPQSTHPIITQRKRHKIPKQWRLNIATNQNQLCGICKNSLPLHYHLDHIVALQFGGTDHQDNLMALCYDCHVQKSKRELACRQEIRHAIQNILYHPDYQN
jgi:5-methylcytosine-specific restriction endonuclease McrA